MDSFEKMSEDDVERKIKKMQTKSCASDVLPTDLLKKSLKGSINIITKIMNMSLRNGVFASKWKTSLIRPLLKKLGLVLTLSNYRPVSNLPVLSKVLEQCVIKQFSNHCRKFYLMPDYQSAYHENYSCETALVKIVDDMLWSMEEGKVTALMALDFLTALIWSTT